MIALQTDIYQIGKEIMWFDQASEIFDIIGFENEVLVYKHLHDEYGLINPDLKHASIKEDSYSYNEAELYFNFGDDSRFLVVCVVFRTGCDGTVSSYVSDKIKKHKCPCSDDGCCSDPKTYRPRHVCRADDCKECFATVCDNCGACCYCEFFN